LAEEIDAGLIVIGSRGLGGVRRALVGSISDAVVRYAHCPVLVVRGEEGEPMFPLRKILLATDGSEEAASAAKTAVEMSNTTNSELHVIHVRMPTFNLNYYEGIYIGDYAEEEKARQRDHHCSRRDRGRACSDGESRIR
jgi:nucleotide-binding universal stress UspA family protein